MITATEPKPTCPAPIIENIPLGMKAEVRWVCWSYVFKDGHWTKVPQRADRRGNASCSDLETWSTYDDAIAAFNRGGFAGIGFVLGDGWAGIDLDDCRSDDGFFTWGNDIVEDFKATYGEDSPSGTGCKIITYGIKPDGAGCSKKGFGPDGLGKLEVYDRARFFTVTGNIIDAMANDVTDCQTQLTALCEKHLMPRKAPAPSGNRGAPASDDNRVKRCRAYLATLPPAISGQGGHPQTFHAAIECFKFGLSESEARTELEIYNQRCQPPWNERELDHKLRDAREKCNGEFGIRLREDNRRQDRHQRTGSGTASPNVGRSDAAEVQEVPLFNTDIGNATRFTQQNRGAIQFCYPLGCWFYWDGLRWRRDESGRAVALGKLTVIRIFDEAQAEARLAAQATDEQQQAKHAARSTALAKHAIASQKRDRINAMLELAKPDLSIAASDLDSHPMLLNCLNGTIDLTTGTLREHRREDLLTKLCNAEYHPDATAPIFNAFLSRIFRTYRNLSRFIQLALGYAATGLNTEQSLAFLYGRGANGKTTLMDAAMNALGDYAAKADPDLLMARDGSSAHPCNVADLMGRRLVVCSETNEGKRFDESKLKDLVGETRLKARFMRQDFFEFSATHKIFIYSNHKPTVRGTDHGFWRRMKLVPFVETISDEEKDADLPAKLKAEATGVLAWIVAGAVAWHREGLNVPQEIADATKDYRNEMDSIGSFLAEQTIDGDRVSVYAAELYAAYGKWCETSGEHALSQRRLGMALTERGYTSDRCTYSNRKKWLGIGLSAEPLNEKGSVT